MCFSGIKVGYVFFFIFFLLLLEVGSGRKSFPLEKDMFLMESDAGLICAWSFVCFSGIKHISAYWVCAFFFFLCGVGVASRRQSYYRRFGANNWVKIHCASKFGPGPDKAIKIDQKISSLHDH